MDAAAPPGHPGRHRQRGGAALLARGWLDHRPGDQCRWRSVVDEPRSRARNSARLALLEYTLIRVRGAPDVSYDDGTWLDDALGCIAVKRNGRGEYVGERRRARGSGNAAVHAG